VPWEEASRYGVCDTNKYGEIVDVVEKPDDPPSNLVMTGFYTFTPAILHACHLVQPSNRGEYEISDAVDLLIKSGRTIDAIRMDGWRMDVGYPEDRDRAEELLGDVEGSADEAATADGAGKGPACNSDFLLVRGQRNSIEAHGVVVLLRGANLFVTDRHQSSV